MKKKLSMLIILFMSLFLISDVKAVGIYGSYTSFVVPYEDSGIRKDGNKITIPFYFEQKKDVDYKLEYDKAIIKSVSLESDYLDYDKDSNKYIVNKEGTFAGHESDSYKDCYRFNNTVTGNLIIEFNDIKSITGEIKIKLLSDKGFIEEAPYNSSSSKTCSNSTIDEFIKKEKEITIPSDLIKNSSILKIEEIDFTSTGNKIEKTIDGNNINLKITKESDKYVSDKIYFEIYKYSKFSVIVNGEIIYSYPKVKEFYNLTSGGDGMIGGPCFTNNDQNNIQIIFESFDGSNKKEMNVNIINSSEEEVTPTTPSEDPKDDDDFIENEDDDFIEDEDNKNNILYIALGVSALIILILVIIIITQNAKKKKQNIETNIDEKIN